MTRLPVVATLLLLLVSARPAPTVAAEGAPALVVVLVVDQMRRDYIEDYGGPWTGGLRRLLDEGAWFTKAAYPYLTTLTCPGHATISTGSFPSTHEISCCELRSHHWLLMIPCVDGNVPVEIVAWPGHVSVVR